MIIKNLTSDVQKVTVEDIFTDRLYDVYIEPHGVTTLDGIILPQKEKLSGIVEVVRSHIQTEVNLNLVQETLSSEDGSEGGDGLEGEIPAACHDEVISHSEDSTIQENAPEKTPTSDVNESKFICDICGAEFASSRGLNSHKNRSHPSES